MRNERLRSIFKRIDFMLPQWVLERSHVCKHDQGCVENCIRKALRTFVYGFGLMMLLKVLSQASKPSNLVKSL
jgi:hypothetical protein